jgi:agmatine deiminase
MNLSGNSAMRRVPAEWEPQANLWLSWPHNLQTWPGHFERIPDFFSRWVRLVAETTPVRVLAVNAAARQCESLLQGIAGVEVVAIATNDCWIRDYGPTFVEDGPDARLIGVNWKYNAWGGKYPPWDLDDRVAPQICQHLGIASVDGELCLEGGALEFDGGGRLLTTPECLITETRNPGWTKDAISLELHRQLGVNEIVWIDGGGLRGDDTDGHIDQLARFIDRQNVVVAVCDDQSDENAAGLEENFRQLHLWGDATFPRVAVHRLPIPPARYVDGTRVPESYCNFLRLGKERLLVPTFAAPTDDAAIGLLRELSGAEVIGIDCRDMVWGLGALHCGSRDQPAGGYGSV